MFTKQRAKPARNAGICSFFSTQALPPRMVELVCYDVSAVISFPAYSLKPGTLLALSRLAEKSYFPCIRPVFIKDPIPLSHSDQLLLSSCRMTHLKLG